MYINFYSGFKQVFTITRNIKGWTMKTSYWDCATSQDSMLSTCNKESLKFGFKHGMS